MENEFITLSCPSCGGKLDVNPKMEYLFCSFCGQKQMLRHHDGAVSLAPVLEVMEGVKIGVDKTASELAIVRLQKEIPEIVAAREKFVNENPAPTGRSGFLTFFISGILAILISIIVLVFGNSPAAVICLGLVGLSSGIFGGLGIWVIHPRNQKVWRQFTLPKIVALDAQIADKKAELEHYRNLVALH